MLFVTYCKIRIVTNEWILFLCMDNIIAIFGGCAFNAFYFTNSEVFQYVSIINYVIYRKTVITVINA